MNGTIDSVVEQVISQIPDSPVSNLVSSALKTCVDQQQGSMSELLQALKNGELTQEEFNIEMAREKQIVEAEMLTWQITSKSEIQKVVNKTFQAITHTLT